MNSILTYKNHINESVKFGVNGLWVVDTDLHDYKWNYTFNNNKISNFNKGVAEYNITVVIACKTVEEGIAYANNIVECAEKDILAEKEGQLFWNDYYIRCYLIKSQKKAYIERKGHIEIALTVVSDHPSWIKENNISFSQKGIENGKNLDFTFDFPFDFASPSNRTNLSNESFLESDFKMIIYGESTNPVINIGGHAYGITGYIAANQYLVIDSKQKTITLIQNNGSEVNYFKNRLKDSYVFKKIPSGENAVTWNGSYSFDIVLYEERSEPKWI